MQNSDSVENEPCAVEPLRHGVCMKMVVVLSLVLGAALPAFAIKKTSAKNPIKAAAVEKTADCHQLISQLKEMKSAQHAMMTSFVKKNATIADALNQMASDERDLTPLTLRRSAKTFRDHQARESLLVGRFETASDQLLDQVEQCLMASPRLSSNK